MGGRAEYDHEWSSKVYQYDPDTEGWDRMPGGMTRGGSPNKRYFMAAMLIDDDICT